MLSLAHIIKLVIVDNTSNLFIAQPITIETMKAAKFDRSKLPGRFFRELEK